MKQTQQRFIVSIPVKPYVSRYLEINYGSPIDFTSDPSVNKFFQDLLQKPDSSRDKQYPETIFTYTEVVEVLISERDFYRYGWELTKTNIVAFGKRFEEQAKVLMRSMVGVYHGLGLPVFKSIDKFQNRFQFDEDVWKSEAIKKDFYRNGHKEQIDFDNEIFSKIEGIILRNLYELGTISKQAKKEYETA